MEVLSTYGMRCTSPMSGAIFRIWHDHALQSGEWRHHLGICLRIGDFHYHWGERIKSWQRPRLSDLPEVVNVRSQPAGKKGPGCGRSYDPYHTCRVHIAHEAIAIIMKLGHMEVDICFRDFAALLCDTVFGNHHSYTRNE